MLACCAVMGTMGCGSSRQPVTPRADNFPGVTLHVGVVVPSGVKAAMVLEPIATQAVEWESTRQAVVKVQAELPIDPIAVPDEIDVLVFPGREIGTLVDQGTLASWSMEQLRPPPLKRDLADDEASDLGQLVERPEDAFQFSDVIPEVRDRVIRYGGHTVALPLGSSALVLVYRRDAFERKENQEAAKAEGLELTAPLTYEQLDALARFFKGHDWDGDGEPESGIALALADDADGVGNATLLARAAALGLHPDYYGLFFEEKGMEPRIATPPFEQALVDLVASLDHGPEEMRGYDASQARQAFREGKVAMLIDRAERANLWSDVRSPVRTAVAPMPGSSQVYEPRRQEWVTLERPNRPTYLLDGGGWLIGVSARSRNAAAAYDFVKYIVSPEPSERLVSDPDFPLLPVRGSQAGLERVDPRRDIRGWGRAVSRTMNAERLVPGLRIPGAMSYEAAITKARRAAIEGTPASSALEEAARGWEAITDRLGRDRQRWQQRSSINIDNPEPEPPPRAGTDLPLEATGLR